MKVANSVNIAISGVVSESDEKTSIKNKKKTAENSVEVATSDIKAGVIRKLLDIPTLKSDNVTALKKQYDEGTYKIDCDKIAEKLIFLDKLWF